MKAVPAASPHDESEKVSLERQRKQQKATREYLDGLSPEQLQELTAFVLADEANPLVKVYCKKGVGEIAEVALRQLLLAEAAKRLGLD